MNPDETRALVRRYLDAFNASDHDAMLAVLAEDVVHDINQGGREIGKELSEMDHRPQCER